MDQLAPSMPVPASATSYPVRQSYDDAGSLLTQTYPSGETVTTNYSGLGGAAGLPTSLSLGNGTYTATANYNALLQPTDSKLTRVSDGTVLFEQQPVFDPVGNVASVSTTLPAGTDKQAFCYDEQDRLTWASAASGAIPCGGSNTAGTLSAASYTQSFSYDTLGRLTSGPLGSYTYGDSVHLHGATSIGNQWTGTYDASGNLTCRAPSSATTCSGTPTGAQLSYNNEGRLAAWQNTPTSPSSTDNFLYDGEGHRVEQVVTSGGATTSTTYVGDLEQVVTSGATTTTTVYYSAGSAPLAEAVNGTLSYLPRDGLGSVTEALSASGTVQATQLYAPYGLSRYSSGSMPTSYGFTGQRADALTGLYYYNARSYDPLAGQFVSADTWLVGLNRFAYVFDNPESLVDPSGHLPPLRQIWEILHLLFQLLPSHPFDPGDTSYLNPLSPGQRVYSNSAIYRPYQAPVGSTQTTVTVGASGDEVGSGSATLIVNAGPVSDNPVVSAVQDVTDTAAAIGQVTGPGGDPYAGADWHPEPPKLPEPPNGAQPPGESTTAGDAPQSPQPLSPEAQHVQDVNAEQAGRADPTAPQQARDDMSPDPYYEPPSIDTPQVVDPQGVDPFEGEGGGGDMDFPETGGKMFLD